MLQIAAIVVGVIAIAMGSSAMTRGEVQLSKEKTLRGGSATAAGVITVVIGLAIIGFALFGLPLLAG